MGRKDGVTRYKTEIRVDNMILLDSKGKDGVGLDDAEEPKEQEAEEPKKKKRKNQRRLSREDPLDDDLPF